MAECFSLDLTKRVPDKFKGNAKVEAGYWILVAGYWMSDINACVLEMPLLISGELFRI
jgi:hypothetical protein